jgi:4'-phosphopantetheinyl transferase
MMGIVTSDLVHLWMIRTDLPAAELAPLEAVLDAAERQRAAKLAEPDAARRFVVAHGAARLIIGDWLEVPPDRLSWQYGENGKPELAGAQAGAQVSLSHSGELAALALTASRAIGVDVQDRPPGLDVARMAARYFPPDEARYVATAAGPDAAARRFLRLWTRKEACVKVAGGKLIPGLALRVRGRRRVVVDHPELLPGPCLVCDVPAEPGWHGALAVAGTAAFRVRRHTWAHG